MPETIMLIDGNSIINRAFYAIPALTNAQNEFTNAVYGFLNIFFKLCEEEKPNYVAVAFDLPKPTFRHIEYAEYKGGRRAMPDELRPQIGLMKNLLVLMGIRVYEAEGFEADDVLGTLSKKAEEIGLNVVLVSGDRDLLQLAGERVKVKIPKTKAGRTETEEYFAKDVIEKIGVTPLEYIDVKGLMGDASDNIPGVPGIGEKTAVKIIEQYKSIEAAIEKAEEIKPKKASENLALYKEQALLSKKLATIVFSAPVAVDLSELKYSGTFGAEAYEEIRRLEFKSFYGRFQQKEIKRESKDYTLITDAESAKMYLDGITQKELVAYKIIYNEDGTAIDGVSFDCGGNAAVFIRMAGAMQICVGFFESDVKKITIDAKRDMAFLERNGILLQRVVFDCMLAGYVLNASKDKYEYNDIAEDYLKEDYPSLESLTGKGKTKTLLSGEDLLRYACDQVSVIYKVYFIMDKLLEENGQKQLYYDIEHPLIEVLKDMELYGMRIRRGELEDYGKKLDAMIEDITEQVYFFAGEEFNINSPKQLGVILFEKLGLKGSKKTKTGWSTAADVLEKIPHPIVKKILLYRTYAKLKSTYVEGLLAIIDEKTGKIYSTFNQTITATGRISSTEPNLQNIPVRLPLGRELRKVFIPENEDYVFLDGDYSQIELRVLAHMSGDETMIAAFNEGQDIHRITASQVLKILPEEVTPEQRSSAKAVNFGIVYGISAYSLSQDLGISKKEADRYIAGYFEKYPGVKNYLDETVNKAREDGYASTIFNRRRAIPELHSSNFMSRSFGERVAMNMPVQGTAADIIKIAMVRVHRRFKSEGLKSRLILQVHDELLVEARKDELGRAKEILKEEMENAAQLKVPLETDFHTGNSWYEAK